MGDFDLSRRDLTGTIITVIDGDTVFVRDKAKEERALQKVQEMKQVLLERTSQGSQGDTDGALLQGAETIINLLSSLHELNDSNEDSVLHFQHQVVKLSIERDGISTKLMGDLSRARSEWEKEKENSESEIKRWKRRVVELGARCQELEKDLKAKEGVVRLWEAKRRRDSIKAMAGEERGSTVTDTTSASTVDTTLDGDEAAPLEIEIEWAEAEVADVEADDGTVKDGDDLAAGKDAQQQENIRDLVTEKSRLLAECQQLEDDKHALMAEVKSLREEHEGLETLRDDLVEKVGALVTKCQLLERSRGQYIARAADGSPDTRPKQCRRVSFSDDVIAKRRVGGSAQTQTLLDIERRVALNTIEDLRAENEALHESIEESMELANGMKDMMQYFTETARATEERLEGLRDERDEAYRACLVLQQEIDLLRRA